MDTIFNRRIAIVNLSLIAVNLLYFLFVEMMGSSEDLQCMIKYGAMFIPYAVGKHQYWRLVTCMFMHFGLDHISNNMFMLFLLGDNLERALGKVKYLLLYMGAGIGANVVSLLVDYRTNPLVVSAGASGAIFGVVGALLWAVIANRGRLEDLSTYQLVILLGLSLYFGFTSTGVDNIAHVAGAVIGFVLSMILYRKKPRRETPTRYNAYI